MTIDELRALYDRYQRIEVEFPTTRREVMPGVVRHSDLFGRSTTILYTDLDVAHADEAIRAQQDDAARVGHELEWKLYAHDRPPDLAERLIAHGFVPDQAESLMILDLSALPGALTRPARHEILPVADAAGLAEIVAVQEAVWQTDHAWLAGQLAAELRADPAALSIYVARLDGRIVSAAWIRFDSRSRFASLWGGSTLPTYRRRGLYTDLLATRAREAVQRGMRFLTIDAGPMSRPLVERFGFRFVATTCPYLWRPA
jgi:hypothetical protein